jgi:hypothetical protein
VQTYSLLADGGETNLLFNAKAAANSLSILLFKLAE